MCLHSDDEVAVKDGYNAGMNRVLVIGATGRVGRQVVDRLPQAVQARALVRNPQAAQLPPHVELFPGDLTAPDSLAAALDGVEAVFLVWTAPPATVAAVIRRMAAQTRRVVFLSAPHQTPHPFFQQPNPLSRMHAQIESAILSSGLEWTILRPGMFSANARDWWAATVRAGRPIRWPYLAAPTAPIDERDIAEIGVQALVAPATGNPHAGRDYVLTGPESLTQGEQIEILGRALGGRLGVEELAPDQARRELLDLFPAPVIEMLMNAWAAALGQPALVTPTFGELAGRPPRRFLEWATDNAGYFRPAAAVS